MPTDTGPARERVGQTPKKWNATTDNDRDWVEDFPHENGTYLNSCKTCGERFVGYKRRPPECKRCFVKRCSAAPAMDLLLRMVQRGKAEFTVDEYFEFEGKAYDAEDGDWNRVVTEIGWSRCRAAAGLPEGETR
jgi:hypothetical protein